MFSYFNYSNIFKYLFKKKGLGGLGFLYCSLVKSPLDFSIVLHLLRFNVAASLIFL
jgi:hypothetical protein